MRKNMFNKEIIMINSGELVYLYKHTDNKNLRNVYKSFYKNLFKDKYVFVNNVGYLNNSIGFNTNKLDDITKIVIEGLKGIDNPHDYIYLDDLKAAIFYTICFQNFDLCVQLNDILEDEFLKKGVFSIKKDKLLKKHDKKVINYLLTYKDTEGNIDYDKNILYYEEGKVYPNYNVKKGKVKKLK